MRGQRGPLPVQESGRRERGQEVRGRKSKGRESREPQEEKGEIAKGVMEELGAGFQTGPRMFAAAVNSAPCSRKHRPPQGVCGQFTQLHGRFPLHEGCH